MELKWLLILFCRRPGDEANEIRNRVRRGGRLCTEGTSTNHDRRKGIEAPTVDGDWKAPFFSLFCFCYKTEKHARQHGIEAFTRR